MAKKSFSSSNPFDNFEPSKVDVEPVPDKEKKEKRYLRLDVTECYDYIQLMSKYATDKGGKFVSMTSYLLSLVEKDQEEHKELYDKLQTIEKMKSEL